MRAVVRRLGDGPAQRRRRAERAVEPGVTDHLDDRRHAAPLLADEPRPRAVELDLGRGIRAVAELVFEPLEVERVDFAVGRPARKEEAREPALGLREHEERIAHRRRAEPLVAGDRVFPPRPARPNRLGDGDVRADVGAALPLGHRHAEGAAALLVRREETRVVVGREHARLPLGGEVGLEPERGDDGERHRDRAARALVHLMPEHHQRAACDVRARPVARPRQAVEAVLDAEPHEVVVRRVVLDDVEPMPVAVVRAEDGRVLVREPAPLQHLGRTAARAECVGLIVDPPAAFALDGLAERRVVGVGVVVGQRRRLVEDGVLRVGRDDLHRSGGEVNGVPPVR